MSRNALYWRILTLCLSCGFVITASSSNRANTDQQVDEDDYIAFADSGLRDEFDWLLLKQLNTPKQTNTIFSPISLKILLGLLYEGAGGTTEQELQNVLQFNANKTIVRQDFVNVLNSLTEGKALGCENSERKARAQETPYTLNLATRVYLDSSLQPLQAFQSKACEKYNTKIESANFTNALKTSTTINQFVNKATNGKISKLVEPDDIKNSMLLFVNALYFRGLWTHQFPKNQTHQGGFYLAPNVAPVKVDYMATTDNFFYIESTELEAKLIRIPYKGKKYAMIIILPNAKAGLQTLIQRLNVAKLKQIVSIMDKQSVDLVLPKFKFNFQARLSDTLKSMGLVSMFQNTASLPGITRGSEFKLEVSDIIQKAGIEVTEEGSTAFASSTIQLTNKFGDAQASFNATHPFVFYIEDQVSHTILFMGKVINPLDSMAIPLASRFSESGISNSPTNAVPEQQFVNMPPPQQIHVDQADMDDAIGKRFNYFDLELMQAITYGLTNENIFVSPASIKTTLGMILEGAKDKSASEIANTLRLPLDQVYVREQLKSLLYDTSGQSGSTALFSSNGIFLSNKLKLNNAYLRAMQEYYKASVGTLNYANNVESVNIINNWISTASRGLIPSIVGPDSLSTDSSIVIANAMYFKGIWKYAFDPTLTTVRCFHLANGQCQNVHMMQNNGELNYKLIGEIDAHALEIPYNDEYAMLILVPQAKNNIQALLRDLQHVTFNSIVSKLEKTEVLYEIPKFEIDYSVALLNVLQQLGIREVFSDRANLSGIVQNNKVKIDNILHKTKIEVNEQGTIAAAATTAIVIPLMGSAAPRVIANHPFLFFIYKRDNRNIIFEGVVNKPLDASPPTQNPPKQESSYSVRPGVVAQRQFRQF